MYYRNIDVNCKQLDYLYACFSGEGVQLRYLIENVDFCQRFIVVSQSAQLTKMEILHRDQLETLGGEREIILVTTLPYCRIKTWLLCLSNTNLCDEIQRKDLTLCV